MQHFILGGIEVGNKRDMMKGRGVFEGMNIVVKVVENVQATYLIASSRYELAIRNA